MKIAYFDCFSGISGDMVLGALVDAGVDVNELSSQLAKLNIEAEFTLHFQKANKHNISGTKATVNTSEENTPGHHHHHHDHSHGPSRHLSDIFELLDRSGLNDHILDTSKIIFDRLAEAEAKVHNTDKNKVHLHEVSGIDSIVDIVGVVIGLSLLEIKEVYSSPLSLGHGFVRCAHGLMPVPVPGTMELLNGIPIRQTDIPKELVTPTGAAIITTISKTFGPIPDMTLDTIGYGAGTRDLVEQPNLLRVCIGEKTTAIDYKHANLNSNQSSSNTEQDTASGENGSIDIIETNIDDMSPEISGYVMEKLFQQGALDVFFIPIQMKKGRPGTQISVLCPSNIRDELIQLLLTETTTFGVRFYAADRVILDRDFMEIKTKWGIVRAKQGYLNGDLIKTVPEYEDCKAIAEKNGIPFQAVYQDVIREL
ncbi:nickel pincer cofactor biosynthesis protein LarC [Candidatus Poribacteria bacterium]|nr:MAG: nickel pincer cofactor biosynthesis protein LarC [Candidatus Poribacteria bacterium]